MRKTVEVEENVELQGDSNDICEQDEDVWCPLKVELIEGEDELNTYAIDEEGDSPVQENITITCVEHRNFVKSKGKKRNHRCDVCSKMFTDRSNLAAHYRIHTGIKPYQCEVCQRRFTERNTLKRHEATHSTERPYQCDMCDRTYTHVNSLNIHKKFHTALRDYKCTQCGRSFATHYNLTTHYRTHTGDKPFLCVVCKKSFTQISTLRRHKHTHKHSHSLTFSHTVVSNQCATKCESLNV